MSSEAISLWTETSSDPELIAGVRAGDTAAFGLLYERHVDAARKVASVYTNSAADVDDVVSEAFSRVLRALQRGDGPNLAFRAYLFTIVRRTGMDTIDKGIRTKPRDDMSEYEATIGYEAPSDEPALEGFEHGLVADAFKSLPERWQAVLWYTEVEKKSPRDIAPLLGLSANGVAALSYRAREALRQAYLQQHLNVADTANCLEANTHLGAFVRGGLSKREHQQVDAHVQTCERCAALVAELEDVNRGMRAIIAPLILGVLATRILDGGLPVGGAFTQSAHTGAAASGGVGGAGGAGGLGTVGSVGAGVTATTAASVVGPGSTASAATAAGGATSAASSTSTGVMGALSSAMSNSLTVLLPAIALTAAVVLVVNIAAVFNPTEDPAPPAIVAGPTTGEPEPEPGPGGDGPGAEVPVPVDQDPGAGELPWVPEFNDNDTPGTQQQGPGSNPGPQQTHTPDPTTTPDPDPTQQPDPDPTQQPDPDPTQQPDPDPTQQPEPEPTKQPEPEPEPTQQPDPDPEPTTPPPPGTPRLAVGTSALDYLTISRAAPKVTVDVSNAGDGAAESVTTTVELPTGLAFATPRGGAGNATVGTAAYLPTFMAFALSQSVTTPEGWQCSFDLGGSVATCELDELPAGATKPLSLDLNVLVSGQLSNDAVTTFSATNEQDSDSYSVRTGLLDFDPQLAPVYVHDGPAAATQVGAPLMGCDFSHNQCANTMGFNGNGAQDRFNNSYWNRGDLRTIALNEAGGERNSATTTLTNQELPKDATVLYATLKWSSVRGATDTFDGALDSARIKVPGAREFMDITADMVQHSTGHGNTRFYYQSTANITDLVAEHGVGAWSLADIALPVANNHEGETYYGGFAITIIYEDPALPHSRVALFEGDQWVLPGQHFSFPFSMHSSADVEVGMVAWEGRRGTLNDLMRICDNLASNSPCGTGMRPYKANGVGDSGNIADSTARGSRWANTLGVDAKSFIPTRLPGRDHVLWAETSSDTYMIGTLTVTIAYQD